MDGNKIEKLNNKADFILIAVPTPITESKELDLFCVRR